MIGGLSLASPLALLALPLAVAGLVYVYRKRGNAVRRIISSSLFLQMLEQKRNKRTKFKPPLRFLLELFLFLILSIGASQLLLDSQKNHLSLIVDNSLSMSIIDTGVAPAQTRLEKAKEQAIASIEGSGLFTEVSVWETSPILRQLNAEPVSASSARTLINQIEQGYGSDNLALALEKVSQLSSGGRVLVFTDRQTDLASEKVFEIHSVHDEKISQNIALLDVQSPSSGAAGAKDITIKIGAFTRSDAIVNVLVYELEIVASKVQERKVRQVEKKIPYGQQVQIEFERLDAGKSYRVEVRPEDDTLDMLRNDNDAWVVANKQSESAGYAGVVSLSSLNLERTGTVTIRPLDELTESPSFTLFYGQDIPEDYDGDALVIMPPGEKISAAGAISAYDETHPLVSYISFPSLDLSGIRPLKVPPWAKSIVETTNGTILYAGITAGKKRVVFGFDPLPYAGKRAPVRSIFILNAFKWLSDKDIARSYAAPGVTFRDTGTALYYASGSSLLKDGDRFVAEIPGAIRQGDTLIEAVNFFDTQESDPAPSKFVAPVSATNPAREDNAPVNGIPLTYYIVLVALLFLFLDYFWFEVRRRSA